MVKLTKKNKSKPAEDLTFKLLNDSRVTSDDIRLYNQAISDFPNVKVSDPITIIDNKKYYLMVYNNYLEKTVLTPNLSKEQMEKCLLNSYVSYMTHMLKIQ